MIRARTRKARVRSNVIIPTGKYPVIGCILGLIKTMIYDL